MARSPRRMFALTAGCVLITLTCPLLGRAPLRAFAPSVLLEIHQINVQQGDCTLIIGPDGTTVLIDAGKTTRGTEEVVPYLQKLGIEPGDGLDYIIVTHRDSDHMGGIPEVIDAGYDIRIGIWDAGGTKSVPDVFKNAVARTTAGAVQMAPLGGAIPLGNGALARIVAVGGKVIGVGTVVSSPDENDRSVATLVQYGDFDYITAGDLGGGKSDMACTGRSTDQANVESALARTLGPGGAASLLTADGVEVLDVDHHGSESGTNSDYMNLLSPRIAVINTGKGQGDDWYHPRKAVVDNVLLAGASCITAPPAIVLQTEEGSPLGNKTSKAGYCCGDIAITTTGRGTFTVSASGAVTQGPDERVQAGLDSPASFPLDGAASPGGPAVVITEIMANPVSASDTEGEWIELYNAGQSSVDINGWILRDDDNDQHRISNGGPLLVPAGGRLVLGRSGDSSKNGGYSPD